MMAALALFLAAVLALAALHKGLARARLAASAARLAGLPLALGPIVLALAATLEALAALALLLPGLKAVGALGAGALWLSYALALWRRRGERLDCGCDLSAREKPVGTTQVLRALLLAALAGAVALAPAGSAFPADAPFAALALLALWFAGGELLNIPQAGWVRR